MPRSVHHRRRRHHHFYSLVLALGRWGRSPEHAGERRAGYRREKETPLVARPLFDRPQCPRAPQQATFLFRLGATEGHFNVSE